MRHIVAAEPPSGDRLVYLRTIAAGAPDWVDGSTVERAIRCDGATLGGISRQADLWAMRYSNGDPRPWDIVTTEGGPERSRYQMSAAVAAEVS